MTPQKFITATLFVFLLLFLLPAAVNIIYDPYFLYRKPAEPIGFLPKDRFQNAGIINSYLADPQEQYDTIIVGTSMSQNFPADTFKNEHGKGALRLTLAGGRARETAATISHAIATGRVKHVIWEINEGYSRQAPSELHPQAPLPLNLYNKHAWDDWAYIFNNDIFEASLKLAANKTKKRAPLETLYSWTSEEEFEAYGSEKNINVLKEKIRGVKPEDRITATAPPELADMTFTNISENILPVIEANPDIRFSLYFPPIPYSTYAINGNKGFWTEMLLRRFVLESVKDLKNVTIYAFDFEDGIGNNIKTYKDPTHYSPAINALMARRMEAGKNIVTYKDWKKDSARLAVRVKNLSGE